MFMDSQKASRKAITQKNKIFIDFLTQGRIKYNPQYRDFFENVSDQEKIALDIEHIVPKKIIEDHIKDLKISQQKAYPVSAVGNLCYLTAKVNRGKGADSLFKWIEERKEFEPKQEVIDCILYPSKSELDFFNLNYEDFREKYDIFIENRQNLMKEKFLELIKKY